jgi:hypothetical protein
MGLLKIVKFLSRGDSESQEESAAPQPATIRLVRERNLGWQDKSQVARAVSQLKELGFRPLGNYRIEEIPELQLVGFGHPEKNYGAMVYEHRQRGVWCELVAHYPGDSSLVVSASPAAEDLSPPWQETVVLKKASIAKLYDALQENLKAEELVGTQPGNFIQLFETAYAREMAWRQNDEIEDIPPNDELEDMPQSDELEDMPPSDEMPQSEDEPLPETESPARKLARAAATGDLVLVEELLDASLHPDTPDPERASATTPLMAAVEGGHLETMRVLIGAGADVDYGDGDADRVLGYALKRRYQGNPENRPRVVQMLIDSGALIDHLQEEDQKEVQDAVLETF